MAHMATNLLTPSLVATSAISRGQALKISSGELVACDDGASSIGDRAHGVAYSDAAAGERVELAVAGGGGVGIAGGTITAGAYLKTDASGHFVATTTAGDIITAIADEAAVDNDVFAIRPTFPFKY